MVITSQEYSRRRQALLAKMQPGSAAIERDVERIEISQAAATELRRGIDHDHLAARGDDAARGGNAGSPGTDHHDIGFARQRRGTGALTADRHKHGRRRGRQEPAAGQHHPITSKFCESEQAAANLPYRAFAGNLNG